jgi:putative toxin-antitoxin system antitoxin component (TIGR02293 family)
VKAASKANGLRRWATIDPGAQFIGVAILGTFLCHTIVISLSNHKHVRRLELGEVVVLLDRLLEGEVVDGADVARVVGTSPRSITRWQSAHSVPRRDSEERLLELKAVIDLLRDVLREQPARLWLRSPNPDLNYEKPLDVVARGEYQRVIDSIMALAEGVTA